MGEQRGLLIRADRYAEAVGRCATEVARIIDLLPQEADALAAKLDLDDVHALRLALKGMARHLRADLAKAFEALAAASPAQDEAIIDLEQGIDA